ncbi:MAG: DNA repair protein RadC [Rickettsiales bacterium]|nr:DNA repair protein RadC [Rickettsiales bacterium]
MEHLNLAIGHRNNLRERFAISKKSLKDHELIEMLLFLAIPRRNTRNLAKLLLKKFGSLRDVLNADENQLISIDGIGNRTVEVIQLFHEMITRVMRDDTKAKLVKLDRLAAVEKYCKTRLGHLTHEEMLVLFLNNSMRLIGEDIINVGNQSEIRVYKNIVITKTTQNGASGIIIVHNHPSGDPNPSKADIEVTASLKDILEKVDIRLYDHLIVTRSQSFSFSKEGLLGVSSVLPSGSCQRRKCQKPRNQD